MFPDFLTKREIFRRESLMGDFFEEGFDIIADVVKINRVIKVLLHQKISSLVPQLAFEHLLFYRGLQILGVYYEDLLFLLNIVFDFPVLLLDLVF